MKVRCEIPSTGADTTPVVVMNDENDSFGSRVFISIGDTQVKVRGKELIAAIECCINN